MFKDEYRFTDIIAVDETSDGGSVVVRSDIRVERSIQGNSGTHYFEYYDANLKMVRQSEVVFKNGGVNDCFVKGDKIMAFQVRHDNRGKESVYSMAVASIADFKFTETELFRVGDIKDGRKLAKLFVSDDKNVFSVFVIANGKDTETNYFYTFDNNLNKKFEYKFDREYHNVFDNYKNIIATKDLKAFFILRNIKTSERKKSTDADKTVYELTRIDQSGHQTQTYTTGSHFVWGQKLLFHNDKLLCVGYYAEKDAFKCKGISFFAADPSTLQVTVSKYNAFTEQFLTDKFGDDKREEELEDIKTRSVLPMPNGDVVLNLEEQKWANSKDTYNDIITARISANGDLIWMRNINKSQRTLGGGETFSYKAIHKGNDTYFFFNANEKVKDLGGGRYKFQPCPGWDDHNLYAVRIKADGSMDYKMLIDHKTADLEYEVRLGEISDSNDVLYITGRSARKKELLKIKL